MKLGISLKIRLLLLLIANVIGLLGTISFFFSSQETDRFKIFMRGVMLSTFLFYSVLYGRKYLMELKKKLPVYPLLFVMSHGHAHNKRFAARLADGITIISCTTIS